MVQRLLNVIAESQKPTLSIALTTALATALELKEYDFALVLFTDFPELLHTAYVASPQFAEDLFASVQTRGMSIVKTLFEDFDLPVQIQTTSGLNVLEYAVNLEDLPLVQYAHQVLGLTSNKADVLFCWSAMMGNKPLIRYLIDPLGLEIEDSDQFLEACVRANRIDMVEFAASELEFSIVDGPGPLVAALEKAVYAGELKPLRDLIDRFTILADIQLIRDCLAVEPCDPKVARYLREVVKLNVNKEN